MKRHFLYIVLILIITSNIGNAQPWTACFNANVTKGCAPLTVTMTDCSGSDFRRYDFGEGGGFSPFNTVTSHTYNTPGLYTVIQEVNTGGPSASTNFTTKVNYIQVLAKPAPVFDVDICAGLNVVVNVTDMTYDQYEINFGDGSPLVTLAPPISQSHTYLNNLGKTITVTGQYNPTLCGGSGSINITPLTALIKPDIYNVTVNTQHASAGQVTIQFNADATQRYYVQQSINNTAAYTNIDTLSNLSGMQNLIYNNLNTSSNQYCYKIVAFDDCNTNPSEEICSTTITALALNNQNQINWTAHAAGNVSTYTLYKNGLLIGTFPAGTLSYTDPAVNCGVNYCYFVIANLTQTNLLGNPLQSISDDQCVNAISTNAPPAVQNLNSTFEYYVNQLTAATNYEDIVILSWTKPASAKTYEILRSVNGSAYTAYTTINAPAYTSASQIDYFQDKNVSVPGNTYCYMINYTDSCGNISTSGPTTCPMILDVTVDNNNIMLNHLSWTPYSGTWSSSYIIEILDENYNLSQSINVGSATTYTFDVTGTNLQTLRYRITLDPSGIPGYKGTYSNLIEIKYEGAVFLPNAFTPNDDGNNDTFIAKGKFIKNFKMTIYNRWGEVVFSSDLFGEGWDGVYKGSPANVDAYAYLIEATDLWGKNITKRGSVTLLR